MASLQQSGVNCMRVGTDGGNNNDSVALGINALCGNSSGSVAIGDNAGVYNNSSSNFIGHRAGSFNSGSANQAIGSRTMRCSGSRDGSIAIGCEALFNSTGGRDVVAIGSRAFYSATDNVQSVAIGHEAACGDNSNNTTAVGNYSLMAATCSENTALGSCIAVTSNNDCPGSTVIGFCASSNDTYYWSVVIGYQAAISGDYHITWGTSNNAVCNCIWANWSYFSDARDKECIKSLTDNSGIELISRMRPVSFNLDLRDQYVKKCGYESGVKDGNLANLKKNYGFIAQEVKQVTDELGINFSGVGYTESQDTYQITPAEFISPLTKAIQNLDTRTQNLKTKVGIL
jgi:hypothetical protein